MSYFNFKSDIGPRELFVPGEILASILEHVVNLTGNLLASALASSTCKAFREAFEQRLWERNYLKYFPRPKPLKRNAIRPLDYKALFFTEIDKIRSIKFSKNIMRRLKHSPMQNSVRKALFLSSDSIEKLVPVIEEFADILRPRSLWLLMLSKLDPLNLKLTVENITSSMEELNLGNFVETLKVIGSLPFSEAELILKFRRHEMEKVRIMDRPKVSRQKIVGRLSKVRNIEYRKQRKRDKRTLESWREKYTWSVVDLPALSPSSDFLFTGVFSITMPSLSQFEKTLTYPHFFVAYEKRSDASTQKQVRMGLFDLRRNRFAEDLSHCFFPQSLTFMNPQWNGIPLSSFSERNPMVKNSVAAYEWTEFLDVDLSVRWIPDAGSFAVTASPHFHRNVYSHDKDIHLSKMVKNKKDSILIGQVTDEFLVICSSGNLRILKKKFHPVD